MKRALPEPPDAAASPRPRDEHGDALQGPFGASFSLFSHQVSGHTPFLRTPEGRVLKPANRQEVAFYDLINAELPDLRPFTPRYEGCVDLAMSAMLEFDEQQRQRRALSLSEDDSPALRPQAAAPADLPPPLSLTSDDAAGAGSAEATEEGRDAEFIQKLWWHFMQSRVQDLLVTWDGRCRYIALEDLTAPRRRPCILDIKMGTRQHGEGVSPEKVARHTAKCLATTSHSLGFRLAGMQVFDAQRRAYTVRDKYWGRELSEEDVPGALQEYLGGGSSRLAAAFVEQLEQLTAVLERTPCLFYSSSLLLIYDGATDAQGRCRPCRKAAAAACPHRVVDVRMIDFAHSQRAAADDERDEGYILGLRNLARLLSVGGGSAAGSSGSSGSSGAVAGAGASSPSA